MKKLKIVCVFTVAVAVLAVSLFNIFWQDRPTVSERENRSLASFPQFSFQSLADGSFFAGIDEYVSDNFIGREFLVDVAKKTESFHGISALLPDNEENVVFIPSKTSQTSLSPEDGETTENVGVGEIPDDVPSEEEETVPEEVSVSDDSTQTETPVADNPTQRPVDYDPVQSGNIPASPNDKAEENPVSSETTETAENVETTAEETVTSEITEQTPETQGQSAETPEQSVPEQQSAEEPAKQEETPKQEEPAASNTESTPERAVPESPAPSQTTPPQTVDSDKAEFLSDGYIIYRNAVHSIPYLVRSTAEKYGKAINHYAELFSNSRVTILVAPLSSGMIDNESIRKKITDQNSMIETINSYCGDNINKVNVYPALFAHRDEYIYYRSDHHWTARGAYYAYAEFAKSVGLEPTPIEDMEEVLLNSKWRGTAYSMTKDERVAAFKDELYAYLPTKKNSMTVYESNGNVTEYNGCVRTSWRGYSAFITGDNPYTIISVPENPSDMTVLVIKDSYGCAFVPYLCEHYRTIIVADPRHVNFDLYDLLKDYPLKDVIFMTNIFNPNVASWVRNVNRIVGN